MKNTKRKENKVISGLDKEHLLYCIFSAAIISLLTGAWQMGLFGFAIFVMLSSGFLYVSWLVFTLLSRILRFVYRKYLRGYLSGLKKAKEDIEEE